MIAVDGQPPQQQPIAISDPNQITNNLSPDATQYRSQSAAFGVGKIINSDKDQIKDSISNGQESAVRDFSAAKVNELKQQQIRDWTVNGSASDETIKDLAKYQNPKSVFEEHYSKTYMDSLNWPSDPSLNAKDNWAYWSQLGDPDAWNYAKQAGSVGLAKDHYITTRMQNDNANWKDYVDAGVKDIFTAGIYGEAQMRQNTAGTSSLAFPGLGHQLQEQADNLNQIKDFDTWRTEFDRVWDNLPPAYRSQWANTMLYQSSVDKWAGDAQTALNVLPVAKGIENLGKNLASSGTRAAASAAARAPTVSVANAVNNQARFDRIINAVKDMTTPRPSTVAPEVSAPAMAGNLHESAVQKVVIDGINELKGTNNPLRENMERMSALYDADGTLAASSPGNLGREAANRLKDMVDAHKQDIMDVVFNPKTQRVDRTPSVELEQQTRNIQQGLADMYKGADNQVGNVSRAIWLPGTNTRMYNIAIISQDADLFKSIEEAQANARRNGLPIKGDYVATPQERINIIRKENAIRGWRVQARLAETTEGKAKATSLADKAQKELDALPRHTTGVTIESQGIPAETGNILNTLKRESIIKQQGNGYYILHTVSLPEDATFTKDGLITSKLGDLPVQQFRKDLAEGRVSTGIPNDWANGWVNAITNQLGISAPSEVLSISENLNRQIATHGPNVLLGLMKRGTKPIQDLARISPKKFGNFNRLLRYLQQSADEETGIPGRWFNTISEVEDWYQRNLKYFPDESEVQAYFAFKTTMLDDLNFRNLSVMSRKLAMGAKQHAVSYVDSYGSQTATPFFEGVRRDTIPDQGRALYVRGDGTKRYGTVSSLIDRHGLENDIKEGRAQLIHIMDPKSKPLRDIDIRGVDYVISYNMQEKPLGLNHVNRQGGGHLVPKWDFFAKQADVDVSRYQGKNGEEVFRRYNGDKTLLSFKSRAQGEEALEHLEPVRKMLARYVEANPNRDLRDIERWENEGGALGHDYLGEAGQLAQRTGIPFSKLLKMWVGPNAAFDVHEPIRIVPKGGKIINLDGDLELRHPGLVDGTKDYSLLHQSMVEFTQERDAEGLWTMRSAGTESNPYFAYEPAELIDPITSLERGYKNIVESMYLHDMKQYSLNHWLEQSKNWLEKVNSNDNFRDNALKHFFNPTYKENIPDKVRMQLEGNRRAALDFIHLDSKYDTWMQSLGQSLFDEIYGKGKFQVDPLANLPKITQVSRWMRNVAFVDAMVSFKAFATQFSTMAYIHMIAGPTNAIPATAAMAMYAKWKRYSGNEEILKGIDTKLSRYMGWKPGQFTEAVRLLEGSGFGHVGAESAFRQGEASLGLQSMGDDIGTAGLAWKTTQRMGRAMLDVGSMPYELGAASTRITGFFISYLEHAAKAPGGVIDRQLQASLLNRASLLDFNMSRAHNMRLQNNAYAAPALQFLSYDVRSTQMMWGKNLTRDEKMRMFAWSSMLFGLRGGGVMLFGLPLANMTWNAAVDAGYVPGDNHLADMAMMGFPSWMFAALGGEGDTKKGTFYDFSKWGNRGIGMIEDFFDTDKSIAQKLLGPVGGVFENTIKNTWGVRQGIADMFKQDGYHLTSDDVIQVSKTLAVAGDVDQAYLAIKYGRLFTRNDTYVTDMSAWQAFLKLFLGVQPIQSATVFQKQKRMQGVEQDIRSLQQHFTTEVTRAFREGDENPSAYHTHMKNATIIQMAIPPTKWKETEQSAFRNLEFSLNERLNEKMYIQLKNDLEMYKKVYQRGM